MRKENSVCVPRRQSALVGFSAIEPLSESFNVNGESGVSKDSNPIMSGTSQGNSQLSRSDLRCSLVSMSCDWDSDEGLSKKWSLLT